ncbi:MAG: hypothetical protein QHH07_08470 [Sedimentisphaerales bacterium]|jgi:hypothetical protein|nr:hypothetical protein [Sedimentisphaerales bacterium]
MDMSFIIAAASTAAPEPNTVNPVVQVAWDQVTRLGLVEAVTFLSFGVVCLIYGWRVYKALVAICFGLGGLILGIVANHYLIGGNVVWVCVITTVLLVILSLPLLRLAVLILGGLAGAIITAGLWLALDLPMRLIWAGGLIGLVAGGMISFATFKAAVIVFSSLQGAALLSVGGLAILHRYLPGSDRVCSLVFDTPWFLPVVLLVPLGLGLIIQFRLSKGEQVQAPASKG